MERNSAKKRLDPQFLLRLKLILNEVPIGVKAEYDPLIRKGLPDEWVAYQVMKIMGWTWDEYKMTPVQVVDYVIQCISAEREIENNYVRSIRNTT